MKRVIEDGEYSLELSFSGALDARGKALVGILLTRGEDTLIDETIHASPMHDPLSDRIAADALALCLYSEDCTISAADKVALENWLWLLEES